MRILSRDMSITKLGRLWYKFYYRRNGLALEQQYMGYPKKEATRMFHTYIEDNQHRVSYWWG